MTSRRAFVLGLLAAAAAPRLHAAPPLPRVAVVLNGTRESHRSIYEAFLEGMAVLGYVAGRNVIVEARWLEGHLERLPATIGELLGLRPEAIVVAGSQAVRAARAATSSVPIVMASAGDPVAQGFIASLERPGGNVTGIAVSSEVMVTQMFGLLHEIFPKARQVAVLLNPANPVHPVAWRQAQREAAANGMTLQPYEASGVAELENALAAIAKQPPAVLVVGADALFSSFRGRIARFALAKRIPSAWFFSDGVSVGGLVGLSASMTDYYFRSANYVHRILSGQRPRDLAVEQADGFDLTVNLETARALGIRLPQAVIARADLLEASERRAINPRGY